MTDTGTPDGTDLSEYDLTFIDVYLRTNNAAQAAKAAGASPRAAGRFLENPGIAAEIARRQACAGPDSAAAAVSLEELIANARAAYRVGEQSGNATAMATATQTLARLAGKWDGEATELAKPERPELVTVHDVGRAVVELFRQIRLDGGFSIGLCGPDEYLVKIGDPLVAAAFAPAQSPAEFLDTTPAVEPVERTNFESGEREVFPNGAWIEFTEMTDGPNRASARKWGVFDARGTALGFRRARPDAIALATAQQPITTTETTEVTEGKSNG